MPKYHGSEHTKCKCPLTAWHLFVFWYIILLSESHRSNVVCQRSDMRWPVAYPGFFLVAWNPPPPRPRFFFKLGVWGTDLHQPLKFANFGNPRETNSGYATSGSRESFIINSQITNKRLAVRYKKPKTISKHYIVYTTSWQLHNHTEHNCCMRLATFSLHPVQNSTTISRSIVRLIDPCVLIPPGVTLSRSIVYIMFYIISICFTTYILH